MNYFIRTSHHFTPQGKYELNKLTSLPMCGFIAQMVEHRTVIAGIMGSNIVEALIFFWLLLLNCLNWKINCDEHSSLSTDHDVNFHESNAGAGAETTEFGSNGYGTVATTKQNLDGINQE